MIENGQQVCPVLLQIIPEVEEVEDTIKLLQKPLYALPEVS